MNNIPLAGWHLGCFRVLAVMNKAAINFCVTFCVEVNFQLLWVDTRSAIAGSNGKSISNFVRNCPTIAKPSSKSLHHSQQWWVAVPAAPHPYQHLVLSVFWIFTILLGVYCCLIVVSLCLSLMTWDVKHLFRLFAITISSLLEVCFRPFVHFQIILNFLIYLELILYHCT